MKEPSTWRAFWIRLPTEALTIPAAIPSPRVPNCFRTIVLTSTKIANHWGSRSVVPVSTAINPRGFLFQ